MIKHFKTNTLIKDILGKGMINDDNLAIIELVKNSIDANAKEIIIIFKYLTSKTQNNLFDKTSNKKPVLIIKDNGKGMNLEDIETKWLNIAYSEKKNKSDLTSHVFAGDKGVGRFSSDRIGRFLDLYTQKENDNIYHVNIDWKDFEKENIDTTIQSIDINVNIITKEQLRVRGHDLEKKGTIIKIRDLRANWTKTQVKDLKNKYLSKLINPNQEYVKDTTKFFFESQDFSELNGFIENKVFKNLQFRTTSIEAYTDYDEGDKKLVLTTTLRHRGQDILTIKETNNRFIDLKKVKIVVYFLNSYAKVRFYKESGERTKDYGSIFLFLNGFRVSPYGEAGNDWLGLEMRRGQGQKRYFSARDIVGRIEITDLEGNFKPVSSREGLVKNNTFSLLVDKDAIKEGYDEENDKKEYGLFYQVITALEKYVVDGLKWDSPVSNKYVDEFEEEQMSDGDLINELYAETDGEKDKRCLDAIQSILRTRKGKIISIDINQELMLRLLEEEEIKGKKLLKNLGKYIPAMGKETLLTFDKVKEIIQQKDEEILRQKEKLTEEERKRKELETQINEEQKRRKEAEEKAQKAEEKSKEEELKRKEAELRHREEEVKRKEEAQKRKEAEEKASKAEKEAIQKQEELNVEKKKNIYLLATRRTNEDTDGLIHHIGILNGGVQKKLTHLIKKIKLEGNEDIKHGLLDILLDVEKTIKISDLITRAQFRKEEDKQNISIAEYIEQYCSTITSQDLKISCLTQNIEVYKTISPLELSIIVDNLVSNAKKWKAKNLVFEVSDFSKSSNSSSIEFLIYDDGLGLSSQLLNNPNQIFELGITESNGSGIGLYFVKDILNNNMNGDIIFVGNNIKLKGACFKIIFNPKKR